MEQLIKITSVPMRTMRFSQSARLVSSDSVEMERRKALARQMSFHRRANASGTSLPMEDIAKINRTFSRKNTTPQTEAVSRRQEISKQQALSRQQLTASRNSQPIVTPQVPAVSASDEPAATGSSALTYQTAAPVSSPDNYAQEFSSSYTTELGALEMRVAKGDLTFLPPIVMTIITQRPELHIEYLGDYNYVPPRDAGSNVNLFT